MIEKLIEFESGAKLRIHTPMHMKDTGLGGGTVAQVDFTFFTPFKVKDPEPKTKKFVSLMEEVYNVVSHSTEHNPYIQFTSMNVSPVIKNNVSDAEWVFLWEKSSPEEIRKRCERIKITSRKEFFFHVPGLVYGIDGVVPDARLTNIVTHTVEGFMYQSHRAPSIDASLTYRQQLKPVGGFKLEDFYFNPII